MNVGSATGSAPPGAIPQAGYAGDIDASQAWDLLKTNPSAALVDVRTGPEWTFVGVPVLDSLGKQAVFVQWQSYPEMAVNPEFVAEVEAAGVSRDAPVLLICRSGARSAAAAKALTAAGFATCLNVSGGFEGPHDQTQHRGTSDGWKALELPWAQG